MSWMAKSLYGSYGLFASAVVDALPLVSERLWQALQPMLVNTCSPRLTDGVGDVPPPPPPPPLLPDAAVSTVAAVVVSAPLPVVLVVAAAVVVAPAGVGAASIRMNAENKTMSDWYPAAGLVAAKSLGVIGVGLSGSALVAQAGFSSRSCGKFSLVTPISTL